MTCLENFPNDLEPTIACGTQIIEFGPVTALLTILIGGPLELRLKNRQEIDEQVRLCRFWS